ncbi:hypothetical protein Ciccas_002474 [Cichlidogyrus casuarinus]|uniref:DNA-directed RNA polymerase III subunit RPC9 n=1 Tax=Cichlidogyrus casuarinus TaxID=1844966 RepID=A0ABD2QI48_9PLAT
MEIDAEEVTPLTNLDVLQYLKELQESRHKVNNQQTLIYTSLKYFKEKTSCSHQTEEQILNFRLCVQAYKLSEAEERSLLDLLPTSQVELSLLIRDIDARFSQDQIQAILKLIETHFIDAHKNQQILIGNTEDEEEVVNVNK